MPDWSIWACGLPLTVTALFEIRRDHRRLSAWLCVPAAAAVYYTLQIIPLPLTILEFLSPQAAILYSEVGADWGTLSLNRYETVLSIVLQCTFVCVLFLGSRVSERQVRKVLTTLGISMAIMSILGWCHLILGWEAIFNLHQPADIPNPKGFITAFVNANTAASFLCLGVAVNLGLTFDQGKATRARLSLLGAYLCASGVLLTQSKGGFVALVCIVMIWVYCLFLNPKNYRIRARLPYRLTLLWFLVPSIVVGFVLFTVIPDIEDAESWGTSLLRKAHVWLDTDYIAAYWLTGSGRGTFEVVYPLYQSTSVRGTVTHAENIVFQLLCEAGLFIGLALMTWGLLLARKLTHATLTSFRPIRWSLWGAILGISLQQTVDFGLEAAGLAIPFALCLGILLRNRPELASIRTLMVVVTLGPISLLVAHLGLPSNPISNQALHNLSACKTKATMLADVKTQAAKAPSDYLIFESGLRSMLRCHPAAWRESLQLATFAQKRHPTRGETRLLTGELMARHKRLPQAASEFRAAMSLSPWLWDEGRTSIQHHLIEQPYLLFEAVGPQDTLRSGMFGYLLVKNHLRTAAGFLDAWIINGLEMVDANRRQSLLCVRKKDRICLKQLSNSYQNLGSKGHASILNAWVAYLDGSSENATSALSAAKTHLEQIELAFAILGQRLASKLSNLELARNFVEHQWKRSKTTQSRASALLTQSRIETELGDLERAVKALNLAYRLQPSVHILLRAFTLEHRLADANACRLRIADIQRDFPNTPQLKSLRAQYIKLREENRSRLRK